MPVFLRTRITAVGPEVADLAEGGIVILFSDGAPPELAEVSVLHECTEGPADEAPAIGVAVTIGPLSASITAIGATAWNKVREIGHVVISFNGAAQAERPGEICASTVDEHALVGALKVGAGITIGK